jgi:hypothetical protein
MTDLQSIKTICTVWYMLKALDGSGVIVEGPTPELVPVTHHICALPWTIKSMAAISFEQENALAVVSDIDIGNTTGIEETDDYYVFTICRQYSFGQVGELEATVLIPQDAECVATEIESLLEGEMWSGPNMDPFRISLKRGEV